jgi:hypothetical protein
MFIEDRLYSANEVTGGMDDNERFYSAEEVGLINDLFSEYYEAHEDFYSDDVERAYADFYDAYSVMDNNFSVKLKEVKRPDPKIEEAEGDKPKYTIGPKTTAGIVTGVGAGAGYLASRLWTKKDKARKAELANKVSKGLASKSDIAELNAINKKLGRKTVGATIAGAGLAYGGLAIANRLAVSKHLAKDKNNSADDSYSFEEFFEANEDHYGDNLEEAFSDYVEAIDAEDNYNLVESVGNVATGAGKVAGNILGSRTKTMAIGTGVSMMRGKGAVSGAKQGLGAHMVGKQITNGVSQFKNSNA